MGKVGFRFLVVFFSWFGALIVFINFVGWSGAYINLSSGGSVDWSNSYFGFTSVQTMIKQLNTSMNIIPFFNVPNFIKHLNDFLDTCAFGLPSMFEKLSTNSYDLGALVKFLVNFFGGQPIAVVVQLLICVAHVLWYAINFIGVVMLAMGGYYNIPFDNALSPTDYINQVRITVPILV